MSTARMSHGSTETDPGAASAQGAAAPEPSESAAPEGKVVMTLLQEHVPISLLADLQAPEGPPSGEILASEGCPDKPWWEQK
jgi:hypothetical protein